MRLIQLQLEDKIPDWAREKGITREEDFDLLESIALHPESEDHLLRGVEDGPACCIKQALEFAASKGMISDEGFLTY